MTEPMKVRINDELIDRIDDVRDEAQRLGYGMPSREGLIRQLLTEALDARERAAGSAKGKIRKGR